MKNFELVQNVLSVLVMALFGVIIGLANGSLVSTIHRVDVDDRRERRTG